MCCMMIDGVSISVGSGVSEEEARALALEEKSWFAREGKSSQELRFQLMETNWSSNAGLPYLNSTPFWTSRGKLR